MADRVTVSADRTRLLPDNAPEKGWRITREEAAEMGLLDADKPRQERRPAFDAAKAKVPPTQKRRYTRKAK